jgi:transposase
MWLKLELIVKMFADSNIIQKEAEMIRKSNKQSSFIDADYICERLVPQDSFYRKFKELVTPLIKDEDFDGMYCVDNGRPAISPALLACTCVLQFYRGLSDREMEEACMYDIRIKHALGLEIDERPFDHSSLGNFRERLLENGREKEIFERIVQHLVDKKLIKKDEIQRIDTTHVLADIAIPSMIAMVKKGVYEIFKILKKQDRDVYNKIKTRVHMSEYRKDKVNQDMPGRLNIEKRKKKLVWIVAEAKTVLRYVEKFEMSKELKDKVDILKLILLENTKEDDKGRAIEREYGKRPPDCIISPVDPDARCGAKSATKRFRGYKANITETVKSRFITNIMAMPGNAHDGSKTVEMIKEQMIHKIKPVKLIGDAAYSSGDRRKQLLQYGTQVVAPMRNKTGRAQHIFPKNMFNYNEEKQSLTCPNGIVTKRTTLDRRHDTITYHFPVYECEICELQSKCTNSWEERRTVGITSWHEIMLSTEKYNRTKQFKKDMRLRQLIEATNSELKRYHKMVRTWYRGIKKVGLQFFFTAAAVNIKRWLNMELEKTKPKKVVLLPT